MSHRCPTAQVLLLLLLLPAAVLSAQRTQQEQLRDHEHKAEHDASFDQKLFLGDQESEKLTGLKRQAALKRLTELFDKQVDKNSDGQADKAELVAWLKQVADKQEKDEVEQQWQHHNAKDQLSWEQYVENDAPSHLSQELRQQLLQLLKKSPQDKPLPTFQTPTGTEKLDAEAIKEFIEELEKKRRRWVAADANKDKSLSKEEFRNFLFPEGYESTRKAMLDEEMEKLDKNRDSKVSIEEFIADMWSPTAQNEEKEPDWVEQERKDFRENKDKNKDGFMDREELSNYLFDDADHDKLYKNEADHLLREADTDKNGQLSRQEVLDNLDLLAGSAATNYGDHLGIREEL